MRPADQVLYGPDVKLSFAAVCYTDDVTNTWDTGRLAH
jgi:hypothetical protein